MKTAQHIAVSLLVTMAGTPLYSDDRVQFETASVKLSKECLYETSIAFPLKTDLVAESGFSVNWEMACDPVRHGQMAGHPQNFRRLCEGFFAAESR
jgi:hypothetical protein